MELNDFKAELKSSAFCGIYVFAGEEDYLVRYYLSALRGALNIDETFAVFNNPVYDGDEVDFAKLVDAVKSPPMMSDYKLIEWRHASFSSMSERDLEHLEELAELVRDYPYSIVAFTSDGEGLDFGTVKKPSKFITKFGKLLKILRFEKSSDNALYSWLKKHFDAEGVGVDLRTLEALVFRSGHSMDVLASEVEKLSALAKARGMSAITVREVEEVASSTPECDTFALSNAIIERNKAKAYAALEEMKVRRVDAGAAMGMIARTYDDLLAVAVLLDEGRGLSDIESVLKMNSYKLKLYAAAVKKYGTPRIAGAVSSLARVDADSKFGGVTGYTAIELFVSQNI
ncbi:MAG: DNA polymerase III subunit delta [Clostridia bacterium]|nr:DNA polymerase III subunit delta [Clostridia bacterium]